MPPLDTRSRDILMILLQAKLPIPVRQVADQLEITPRMMRSNLDVIHRWLGERGASLIRKPNVGVFIEASSAIRENLIHELSGQKEYLPYLSQAERVNILILILLKEGETPVPVDQIEPVLGISRPTLFKDLGKVAAWLHGYELELAHIPRAGLQVTGGERNWREAVTGFLLENYGAVPLLSLCKVSGPGLDLLSGSALNLLNTMQVDLLRSLDLPFSYQQIKELEQKLPYRFTDISFAGLVTHLALAIARVSQKKPITSLADPLEVSLGIEEQEAIQQMAKAVNYRQRIILNPPEIDFFTRQILGAKKQYTLNDLTRLSGVQEENPSEPYEIVESIVHEASLYLHPSLQIDRQLIRALSFHIPVALNRLRFDLPIRNPLLKEVQARYPHILHIARKSLTALEGKIQKPIPEDEVAYIAMHLGAAMERLRPYLALKRKVWIVCGEGSATVWLLVSGLQAEFPDIEVVEVTSVFEILRKPPLAGQVDAVLTTVPVSIPDVVTLQVSPLLTGEDQERIRAVLEIGSTRKTPSRKMDDRPGLPLSALVMESAVQLNAKARSWEEVVDIAGRMLLATSAIYDRYIEAMKEAIRQFGPYVVFAPGVALLHARPEDGVNRICLSLVTLDPPVPFGHSFNDPVSVAIVLGAVDNHSHLKALAQLANLLTEPQKIEQIRSAQSKTEVVRLLSIEG